MKMSKSVSYVHFISFFLDIRHTTYSSKVTHTGLDCIKKLGDEYLMPGSYKCTACIRPYINPNWPTGKISLERLAANAKVATVLVSIPVSSDTVEFEERQMKQCWHPLLHSTFLHSDNFIFGGKVI